MLVTFSFIFLSIALIILGSLNIFYLGEINSLKNIRTLTENTILQQNLNTNKNIITALHSKCINFSGGRSGDLNFGSLSDHDFNKKIFNTKKFKREIKNVKNIITGNLKYGNTLNIFLTHNFFTTNQEYTTGNQKIKNIPQIKIKFNFPKIAKDNIPNFLLDDGNDINGDGITNDEIILRKIKGYNPLVGNFEILPTGKILNINGGIQIDNSRDSRFREKDLNLNYDLSGFDIEFSNSLTNLYNPIKLKSSSSQLTGHYYIADNYDTGFSTTGFENIFENSENIIIQLSLANILQTKQGTVIPYLNFTISTDNPVCIEVVK